MVSEKLMPKLNVTLLTGRTLRQGQGKEYGKTSERYWESVTTCEIDPEDMNIIGVTEGQNIRITTDYGSVIVKAMKSLRGPHRSVVFVSLGPWINTVVNSRTHGIGMPSFKGVPAIVEPALDEKVLQLKELLKENFKKE
jgi:formylmethanofuran dehydrogenase subunit D